MAGERQGRKPEAAVAVSLRRAKADYSEKADKADKNNINRILNDLTEYCWIAYSKSFERSGPHLGGVHRRADFELISVRRVENLWDYKNHYHIVTGREILGLLHFGYAIKEGPAATATCDAAGVSVRETTPSVAASAAVSMSSSIRH